MGRVQAAEAGTIGHGRQGTRRVRKDELVDLPDGEPLRDWMVAVPNDTKAPLQLARDPKTKQWKVVGEKAKPDEGPRSFSEAARANDKAAHAAAKAKTALDS